MSSSTVSITANRPGPSLRRPTLTGDKKSALDATGNDELDISPATGDTTSRAKDLTHSTKQVDTLLERSVQTKNPIPTNSTTKLRKRTVVKKATGPSPSRPPWKTAVSVIVKNLGLLAILLVLIQMVRRLGFNQGGNGSGGSDSVLGLEYERRIAEVEAFLKTTTKMMQVQVDVVDRKIENEVKGLRTELSKRIDDERVMVNNRFSEFDGRVGSVEKAVTGADWLSRDEFDKFVEEFRGVDDVGELRLDEIRAFAREIVEKEIGKHAADGLGRVDYAVASGGAKVLRHSEAYSASRVMGWFSGNVRSDAMKVLQPSFGQPGECFPLKGDTGFVDVKLRTAIVPEAITLEHVSKSVAFDISSAPKHCKIWGWLQNEEDTQKEHLLTEFTYDLEKSVAQTFNVLDPKDEDSIVIDTIRLELMSNHGSPTHTCIYRVRVHGHQPNES
ncbi:putative SUN domain-containing protein [Helianthus debilis subsp. tardiflorus]